jgi:gamma-glutamyltranspeptidase/glutathione hydrolase
LFALVYVAKEKKLYALNSGGWSPAGWTPEFFTKQLNLQRVPTTASTPRPCPARSRATTRYSHASDDGVQRDLRTGGADRRRRLGLAERRIPTARRRQRTARRSRFESDVLNGEDAPDLYSVIRNPNLSKALRLIQKQGRMASTAAKSRRRSSPRCEERRRHEPAGSLGVPSEWVEPISTEYHGYDVFELPPPGQGFAALEMLNILEACVPKLGIT